MKKNILYFCLYLLFPFALQANNMDDSKNIYADAEQYFVDENYSAALPLYLKLDSIQKGNADVNFKIGFCYLNSATYKTKAIPYLEEAIKNISDKYVGGSLKETTAPVSSYYYLAKAYHLNYEWDKAIATYEKYISALGTDSKNAKDIEDTQHDIETCKFGKELIKNPIKVIITNLGPNVNSEYPDFSPVLSLDEQTLIFTSRRKGGASEEKLPNGQYLEDIYVSKYVDGQWEKAVPIGPNINTPKHEATINLSADGQTLLIYRDQDGGNIYVSELSGTEWSVPKILEAPVNTASWEPHACLTSDNRTLYFVSDRPGGFGGRDIYKCLRLPSGKWGAAQNLGERINTKYDEDGIFIHPDGKQIYFSSKGHQSMGGFDIFTSQINDENGNWTVPVNYGYPVNTPDDDVFFVTSVDGRRGYFSSDKEGGFGEKDIYLLEFPEFQPRDITVLIGRIINNSGGSIANNEIAIVNTANNDTIQILNANSTTGKFGANLPVGATYKTIYRMNGREFFSEVLEAPRGGGYNVISKDVPYGTGDAIPDKKLGAQDPKAKEQQQQQSDEWFKERNDEDELANKVLNKGEPTPLIGPDGKPVLGTDGKPVLVPAGSTPLTGPDGKPVIGKDGKPVIIPAGNTPLTGPDGKPVIGKDGKPVLIPVANKEVPCNLDQLNFEMYFKYNQNDSEQKRKEFLDFCDNLKSCVLSNPGLVIQVEASASKVPTRKWGTNERLAHARASSAERKVIRVLGKRGVRRQQITFERPNKELVQGPEYNHDAKSNRSTYEQFQYIKIKAYIKK